jgi:hypothetical protein
LAVDGSSGASRGHAPVVRRAGARWSGAARPSAFQGMRPGGETIAEVLLGSGWASATCGAAYIGIDLTMVYAVGALGSDGVTFESSLTLLQTSGTFAPALWK